MNCGLLGEKLGHSYSPAIHAMLADYDYRLYEKAPGELADYLLRGGWDVLNVTIPYKKAVMPYCAELSDTARRCGSVNTLLRLPGGAIRGENTDAYGFSYQLQSLGFDPAGKKCVIFGSGGASATVRAVLAEKGAGEIVTVSRSGGDNYENLARHADAAFVVNATPAGMFPHNGGAAASLTPFTRCEAVADLIYNPARTALLMEAERLGIPCANGLGMLAAQAKRSAELFLGTDIPDGEIARIEEKLSREMQNIVLIGMPGCGKSTVGKLLAEVLGREFCESDALVEREAALSIPEIGLSKTRDCGACRARQALRRGDRHGRRLCDAGGELSPAASKRRDRPAAETARQTAARGQADLASKRYRRAVRTPTAFLRTLCGLEYFQRRNARGNRSRHHG